SRSRYVNTPPFAGTGSATSTRTPASVAAPCRGASDGSCVALFAVVVLLLRSRRAEPLRLGHLESDRRLAVTVQLEDTRAPFGGCRIAIFEQTQVLEVTVASRDQPRRRMGVLVEPELRPLELPRRRADDHRHPIEKPVERGGRVQVDAGNGRRGAQR